VGSTATKCHECGASLTFSLAAASRLLSGLLPGTSPITYTILGLNFLLFGVSLMASLQGTAGFSAWGGVRSDVLLRLGARNSYLMFQGELWRLVMPIFLHGSLLHFAMNTIVLLDLGPQVEGVYGSARYLFLYVASGVAGFVVSTAWSILARGGLGISIGASGALMGLIGLLLAISTRHGGAAMQMIRGQLIRWVVYIFVLGIVFRGTDNAAHLGGLVAGFLLGKVLADREPVTPSERQRAQALGWLAALAVMASFAAILLPYLLAS
jgi:rhomboid protease GluP